MTTAIITTLDISPKQVLKEAVKEGDSFETVTVIGRTKNDELFAASSTGDLGTIFYLLDSFKHEALSGDF